jgi:hypothetical protein
MSIVTPMQNKQIVELAKQRYEKQQKVKVPGHIVKLPSNGLIYPATSPLRNGSVEIRVMTAYEEDIITNASYINAGIVFNKLIDSVLLTENVSADDIGNSDIEGLVIMLRALSYGNTYSVEVRDPKTSKFLKRDVNLSDIERKPFTLQPDDKGFFDYTRTDNNDVFKFKYITSAEANTLNSDTMISGITELSIQSINGNSDRNFIGDYVRYHLPAGEARKFRNYISDNMYGLDLNLTFEGETEGSTFEARFPIGENFFWI